MKKRRILRLLFILAVTTIPSTKLTAMTQSLRS